MNMKHSALFMAAAVVAAMATSCLKSGESRTDYVIQGTFEAYNTDHNTQMSYFTDSLYFSKVIPIAQLTWLNSNYEDSSFFGGFFLSMKKDSLNADGTVSMFSSSGTGAGARNSSVYAVYSQTPSAPEFGWQINLAGYDVATCKIRGFYINNVSSNFKASQDSLKAGDYLRVTVNGYLGSSKVGSSEMYLIDYRGNFPTVVGGWKEWLLDDIGNVDALQFIVETNRSDFSPSFCMDNFSADVHLEY